MPITFEDAYAATNPDPQAYGLPEGASEEDVNKRREDAARNIVAGVAANDAYWDSRNRLESLEARAQGHGLVSRGPNEGEDSPTLVGAPTASGETIDTTEAPATVLEPGSSATEPAASVPSSDAETVAKLRAQVESLGGTPEV